MSKGFWLKGAAAFVLAFSLTGPTLAQDGGAAVAQPDEVDDEDAADDEDREKITVTGSRIRRDEFSSSQPLQVIDAAASRSFGIVDTGSLIQENVTVTGAQVDATINTASGQSNATERPPNNGPGSSTVSLRGLDAERTLVLLNGRRLAPAGAGGAPTRPDLNLIPSSMVERVEILTGGASAVYGADAVAGVVNVILRSDFEGVEFQAFRSMPEESGGEASQLSFIVGASNDRGNVTFAGEYYERNRVAVRDREIAACGGIVREIFAGDPDGDTPNAPSADAPVIGNTQGLTIKDRQCFNGFPDNSVQTLSSGQLVFFDPGASTTISGELVADWSNRIDPNFLDTDTGYFPVDVRKWEADDNGFSGFEFGEYNGQDERLDSDLVSGLRRFSFLTQANQEIDLPWLNHTTNFFAEGWYANRQTINRGEPEQALPIIPAVIPGLNEDGSDFIRDGDGDLVFFDNPLNPFAEDVLNITIYEGTFPQVRNTEVEQIRLTGGFEGNFESLFGFGSDWAYELFTSYDRTMGNLDQTILFEPNVYLGTSLVYLDPDGNPECGIAPFAPPNLPFVTWDDAFGFTVNPNGNCVPIDWLAPDALDTGSLTPDEEAYLQALRTNRTIVEQANFGGYMTGGLFDIQGGTVQGVIGAEYRIDKIDSRNDVTVTRGLQASETVQSEGNATGETWQKDLYGELEIPLLAGQQLAEELTLNLSARYTQEKNFGEQETYSVRGTWGPTDWLSFRGSYGTSFRAPNLREQFLAQNASGTAPSSIDPCRVPAAARMLLPDGSVVYNAAADTRSAALIANCVASGADPTLLGIDGFSQSVPTFTTGTDQLDPETGKSWSLGFVVTNPVWQDFIDTSFSLTFWNVEVEDTVEELSPGGVVSNCYFGAPNLADPNCARITRLGNPDPVRNAFGSIETSFINVGKIEAEGFDINLRAAKDVNIFQEPVTLGYSTAHTYLGVLARQEDATDPSTRRNTAGAGLNPRWRGQHVFSAFVRDFQLNWRINYISATPSQRPELRVITAGDLIFTSIYCGQYTGGSHLAGQVGDSGFCRDVDYTEDYFKHDASIQYDADTWSLTFGVNNVFNEDPPIVGFGFGNRNNVVTQGGYDIFGRTYFVNLNKTF